MMTGICLEVCQMPFCQPALRFCHFLSLVDLAWYLTSVLHHLAQPARHFWLTIPCAFLTVCIVAFLDGLCFLCLCTNTLFVRYLASFRRKVLLQAILQSTLGQSRPR